MVNKKLVYYRVDGQGCRQGYQDTTCSGDGPVYDINGVLVPDAVVVPPGTCPQEVVIVEQKSTADVDYEKSIMCSQIDGRKVLVVVSLANIAAPVTTYWDLVSGTPWVGSPEDLGACHAANTDITSEVMCNDGVEFLRWFVVQNGQPTGVVYDTTVTGEPYTANGAVTVGKCPSGCPSVTFEGVDNTPW